VRDVHLIPVGASEVMMVVVTGSGNINQAVLHLPGPVTPDEVLRAGESLATRLVGTVLGEDDALDRGEAAAELSPPSLQLYDRALEAADAAAVDSREVYVGGASRMTELWEDLAQLHRILALLDRQATVLGLLDEETTGTSVRLGSEIPIGEEDLAVVSSSYEAGGGSGRMGVFGPMRMDYRRTIRVVEEVSDALGDSLGG
jgi:heat-inducible transcriptional repressor